MNLQKRSEGGEEESNVPATPQTPNNKQKPVFFYIVILFAVAFALILISFFMHQRSNQEVLGELHNNVNALEQLQDALDENLLLQKKLEDAEEENQVLRDSLADVEEHDAVNASQLQALTALYDLQQSYAAEDYATCATLIAEIEETHLPYLLKSSPTEGVISPRERYFQFKEAAAAKLAEEATK